MGRIGLIVLLLMTAIILMVAAIVAAGYAFVFLVEHFANGP